MTSPNLSPENQSSENPEPAGEHPFGDAGQIICLLVFLAAWILDSFVFRFSNFLAHSIPFPFRVFAALLFLVSGIYLANSGHRAVFHEHHTEPRLIMDGAFAHVRHPLYLAALLFYLFLFCLTLSLASLIVFLGCLFFYNHIADYEERRLEVRYGQDYRDYRAQVPKWIPRFRSAFTRNVGNPPD